MNRKQWFALSIIFWILMFLFIRIDLTWNLSCDISNNSPLDNADIVACVNSEIYDPFIWLFFGLAVIFSICAWLEPKKK